VSASRLSVTSCLILVGCGRVAFGPVQRDGARSDEGTNDVLTSDAAMPFGAPVLVSELVDVQQSSNPTLAADELELFLVRRPTGNNAGDIYQTKRAATTATWDPPVLVNELSSAADESGLFLSRDALTMWFASARAGGHDIYTATRPDRSQPFAAPVMVSNLSSLSEESSPAVDAAQLYYLENFGAVPRDLRASRRASTADPWPVPAPITELSNPADDSGPAPSPDALTLYFTSDRTGTQGGQDLWVSTRPTILDPFGAPIALVELNSAAAEITPWISPDGRVIYFASDRSGVVSIYRASR